MKKALHESFLSKYNMLIQQPTRPFCEKCKMSLAKPNGISKHGFKKWHKYCVECANAAYHAKVGYLLDKHPNCESCGFVPADKCQLDVIYKDGDRKNKSKDNTTTLCANCSRLYKKKLREAQKSILNITVDSNDFRL